MRLLGLDLETTGLDTANDRVTELGLVLWDSDKKAPIKIWNDFLIDDGIRKKLENPEVVSMMDRLCGITPQMLEELGSYPSLVLDHLCRVAMEYKVDYIVAHNGENFDRPLLYAELSRHEVSSDNFRQLPWLDTKMDIPHETPPASNRLMHLALDCGFINPFAHRAVFDVLTMLKVLSHYDLEKVIEYSKVPFITVRAVVSYDDREKAKAQRFSWEKLGERTYPKMWIKKVKLDAFEKEKAACNFQVVRIE